MAHSRICSIPGCGKRARGHGWCSAHYSRWRLHGDPLAGRTPNNEPKRFYAETVLPYEGDECLLWPYAKFKTGYAEMVVNGKHERVSRLACEYDHGPAPSPKHVAAHSCGNGHLGCVARRHLSWKTHAGNAADKLIHGTNYGGERHHQTKLLVTDVLAIRSLKGIKTQAEIGLIYGIGRQQVGRIQQGLDWKNC